MASFEDELEAFPSAFVEEVAALASRREVALDREVAENIRTLAFVLVDAGQNRIRLALEGAGHSFRPAALEETREETVRRLAEATVDGALREERDPPHVREGDFLVALTHLKDDRDWP